MPFHHCQEHSNCSSSCSALDAVADKSCHQFCRVDADDDDDDKKQVDNNECTLPSSTPSSSSSSSFSSSLLVCITRKGGSVWVQGLQKPWWRTAIANVGATDGRRTWLANRSGSLRLPRRMWLWTQYRRRWTDRQWSTTQCRKCLASTWCGCDDRCRNDDDDDVIINNHHNQNRDCQPTSLRKKSLSPSMIRRDSPSWFSLLWVFFSWYSLLFGNVQVVHGLGIALLSRSSSLAPRLWNGGQNLLSSSSSSFSSLQLMMVLEGNESSSLEEDDLFGDIVNNEENDDNKNSDPSSSSSSSWVDDLSWRVMKVRLEEANTRRFLKAKPRFLPYAECRAWVKAWSRWDSERDWRNWIAMGEKRNSYIPSRPDEYYGRLGQWISWDHFLGKDDDSNNDNNAFG